jgi:hypothetical protein
VLFNDTGSIYRAPHGWMLFTDKKDWYSARDTCQSLEGVDGGQLTELMSKYDKDSLATWLASKGVKNAWIGLTTDNSHWDDRSSWYWAKSGVKPDYDAWAPGYPSALWGICGSLVATSQKWQSNRCAWTVAFVCDVPY